MIKKIIFSALCFTCAASPVSLETMTLQSTRNAMQAQKSWPALIKNISAKPFIGLKQLCSRKPLLTATCITAAVGLCVLFYFKKNACMDRLASYKWTHPLLDYLSEKNWITAPLALGTASTRLGRAVENGNLNQVKYLVEQCHDPLDAEVYTMINGGSRSTTLLELALENGSIEIIKYLITTGKLKNSSDLLTLAIEKHKSIEFIDKLLQEKAVLKIDLQTHLCYALKANNFDIIKCLVKHGTNINAPCYLEKTPLTWALSKKKLDLAKKLIEDADLKTNVNVKEEDDFKQAPLYYALEGNNIELIKYLVKHGADINVPCYLEETPLTWALKNKKFDLAKKLIEDADLKTNVNIRETDRSAQSTPLYYALENNNIEMIKYLVEKGANITLPCNYSTIPIKNAIEKNNLAIFKILIENSKEFNINTPNSEGESVIFDAIIKRKSEILNYLIEKGADLNKFCCKNWTPLGLAININEPFIMETLVKTDKIDINKKCCIDEGTPLYHAVKENKFDLIKLLVKHGADINKPCYKINQRSDYKEETPLIQAIKNKNFELAKKLIEDTELKVNINAVCEGNTPLGCALDKKNSELITYLAKKGADINLSFKNDPTPIEKVIYGNRIDDLKNFIQNSTTFKINKAIASGSTAIGLALAVKNIEILKYLIEEDADLNQFCTKTLTPFGVAIENRDLKQVKLLRRRNADVNVICNIDKKTPLAFAKTLAKKYKDNKKVLDENKKIISYLKRHGAEE